MSRRSVELLRVRGSFIACKLKHRQQWSSTPVADRSIGRCCCHHAAGVDDRSSRDPQSEVADEHRQLRRKDDTMNDNTETAILAAGCFWGVQELLRHRDGVISTRVGYTGGGNDNPTYGNHPGHAEAVKIVFDPERISYRDILEFFFQIHDPTTKDRQGY